jgi:hypothetical protein
LHVALKKTPVSSSAVLFHTHVLVWKEPSAFVCKMLKSR